MNTSAKLAVDLLFGILCVVGSPVREGTIYDVAITDKGVIDVGTIEVSGGTFSFFDGAGESKRLVMSLTALEPGGPLYRYEHVAEPAQVVNIDQLILNRGGFDAETSERFTFRMGDSSSATYMRFRDVIYIHLGGTANTIVLHK